MFGNCGWDPVKWLERLIANAKVATVLGSIPVSSYTVESEERQMKKSWIKYTNVPYGKNSLYGKKIPPVIIKTGWQYLPKFILADDRYVNLGVGIWVRIQVLQAEDKTISMT